MASRIVQLAKVISDNAALIDEHLRAKGAPTPSFDVDAPKRLDTSGNSETLRNQAIAAASEFIDLLKGPADLLRVDWTENSSLRVILRLKIAAMVPVGAEVSFAKLAEMTELPERDIQRILRHAMVRHIFCEPRKGFVAHTALSRLLAEDEHQYSVSSTVADVFLPVCLNIVDAVSAFPGSEEADQSAFSLTHNPGKTMWQIFSERPVMGQHFGKFIGQFGASESLLRGVGWKGTVVDVGGSYGDAMINILEQFPQVETAIVQDLPDVVEAGQKRAPADLAGRLVFKAHDFFVPQSEPADIFFFRWIFHNWSNKYSKEIIRNLVPVMKPDTTIIVNDYLLPEPNTLPPGVEKMIRNMDMTMLGLLNATERDVQGWHDLFYEADPRFKIKKIDVTPPGVMAIIEVGWQA